jgi:predicted metal-binding transcription factor (methanogenesis marker protein 9)
MIQLEIIQNKVMELKRQIAEEMNKPPEPKKEEVK